MPLIAIISTAIVEGVKNMLSALRQEKYREEGKAEGITEGEARGKDAEQKRLLSILEKDGVDEVINQIKNGNTHGKSDDESDDDK